MIIIGEKINATRKSIAQAIHARNRTTIIKQIESQDQKGAHYIDLNAGTGTADENQEIEDICWLIDLALEATPKKISIDSANPLIIHKAVDYLDERRPFFINSVKHDKHILDSLLPVAAQHNAPVIALAMGSAGIPETAEERVLVCQRICEQAEKHGLRTENLFFDPLVMPLSSNHLHGKITLETLQSIKKSIPEAKTSMGISNVSFGLSKRVWVNEAFMVAAITHGLDAAICDPARASIRRSISLGRMIAGKDRFCRKYTRGVRRGDFEKPIKVSVQR